LFGYFLKPGPKDEPFKHFKQFSGNKVGTTKSASKEIQVAFERYAKAIKPVAYINEMGRAQAMADAFLDWAFHNGFAHSKKASDIGAIFWTAQSETMIQNVWKENAKNAKNFTSVPTGGMGLNPTDVLVEFKCGKTDCFLGMSAKSTKKYAEIPFTNPGIGTIADQLWSGSGMAVLDDTIDKGERSMVNSSKFGKVLDAFVKVNYPNSGWMQLTNKQKDNVYKHIDSGPGHKEAGKKKRKYPTGGSNKERSARENKAFQLLYKNFKGSINTKGNKGNIKIADASGSYSYLFYEAIKIKYGLPTIGKVRSAIMNRISDLDGDTIGSQIGWQGFFMNFVGASAKGPHYIKCTGRGDLKVRGSFFGAGGWASSVVAPTDKNNKKIIALKQFSIWMEESEWTSFFVCATSPGGGIGNKLFKVRVKFESRPFSSTLKLSGDPVSLGVDNYVNISDQDSQKLPASWAPAKKKKKTKK
jgi:hypothetical protein